MTRAGQEYKTQAVTLQTASEMTVALRSHTCPDPSAERRQERQRVRDTFRHIYLTVSLDKKRQ